MAKTDLETAVDLKTESSSVDYKISFDTASAAEWLEVIKDVVAMANSGGGMIIFGIADDGSVGAFDCTTLKALDPATLTDKIYRYTGQQFGAFDFCDANREGRLLFAIVVQPTRVPIVFSKPGTYDIGGGKQKTAFSSGTIYFRHGTKSEPGNCDDLRSFIESRIEEMRKIWFEGIVKVVEAPIGSQIKVITPQSGDGGAASVRLVNDESAPTYRHMPVDETHPHRQKEVLGEFHKLVGDKKKITSYHVQCVRKVHDVDWNPTFCHRMQHASPQFSDAFVQWLVNNFSENPSFFEEARDRLKQSKQSSES